MISCYYCSNDFCTDVLFSPLKMQKAQRMNVSLVHLITTCSRLSHHASLSVPAPEKEGCQLQSIYKDIFDLRKNMSFYIKYVGFSSKQGKKKMVEKLPCKDLENDSFPT